MRKKLNEKLYFVSSLTDVNRTTGINKSFLKSFLACHYNKNYEIIKNGFRNYAMLDPKV